MEYIQKRIDEYQKALATIGDTLNKKSPKEWHKALRIAMEEDFQDIADEIGLMIINHVKPTIEKSNLVLNVYDMYGNRNDPTPILYKNHTIGFLATVKGHIEFVDLKEKIEFYQMLEEKTKRSKTEEISVMEDSYSMIKILKSELIKIDFPYITQTQD